MRTLLLLLALVAAAVANGDDRETYIDSQTGLIYFEQLIEPNELTKPKRDDYWFNHGNKNPEPGVGMTNEFINGAWSYLEPVAEVAPEPSSWLLLLTAVDRSVMAGGMAIGFLGLVICALEWVTWRNQ